MEIMDTSNAYVRQKCCCSEWCPWPLDYMKTQIIAPRDPLSPYLFIIAVDLLSKMITADNGPGELASPRHLDFSSDMTGLQINFHKSIFVPLQVQDNEVAATAQVLGCEISSFSQTDLKLPLSVCEAHVSILGDITIRVERCILGWCTSFLSSAARLTLAEVILSAVPIYAMSVLLIPKRILGKIDGPRKGIFWKRVAKCNGETVRLPRTLCRPKANGGVGLKDLATPNKCLILKNLHKLYNNDYNPWANWTR
ncbi:hypothetical protein ACP70R_049592 [Stipagrostis hirtigluma subsp. patula]